MLENHGVHPARFWVRKASVRGELEVVLAGDSRVFRGLSPSAMKGTLAGRSVANLGFSGACLCGRYLSYVEAALDPRARTPLIVLGITPHSLTAHAAKDNGYVAEARRSRSEALERAYLTPAMDFFEPVTMKAVSNAWTGAGRPPTRYVQRFADDGWVASDLEPPEPDGALREYEAVLGASPVDRGLVAALVATTARWAQRGVRVVGFRPPVSARMRELEDRLGAFDEPELQRRFVGAGGEYLVFDDAAYPTYDGSHVGAAVALALSRDLAARLGGAPRESAPGTP